MKTNQFLKCLYTAAYPLVTVAATLAAALCISTPVLAQQAAPLLLGYTFSQDSYGGAH